MKLTKERLKQIIKEEFEKLNESDPHALKTPEETIREIASMMQGMKQTELDDIYHYVLKRKQRKSKYQDPSRKQSDHNKELLRKQKDQEESRWGTPEDEREQAMYFGDLGYKE